MYLCPLVWPRGWQGPVALCVITSAGLVILFNVLYNYAKAVLVDPGRPPEFSKVSRLNQAHEKGGCRKGGIRICLPVHCLSARSDRQPYCHTNATYPPCLKDDQIVRDNCLPVHCRHLASRRHRTVIPVATQMLLPPVCYPLFKRSQLKHLKGQLCCNRPDRGLASPRQTSTSKVGQD